MISNATSLLVKKLSNNAQLPTRGSPGAAGYDLYAYSLNCLTIVHMQH